MKNGLSKTITEIEEAEKIGLMTHVNGDGDAFGSVLGLRNILEMLGKRVVLFSNEPLLKSLEYLSEEARYDPKERYEKIDLLIITDTGVEKRLTCPSVYRKAKNEGVRILVIDHHAEGDIYNEVDTEHRVVGSSSSSEIVFWLSQELGMRLDKVTSEFLLFGIESDTNFLQNPNTVNKTTYTAKSILLRYGARTKEIKKNIDKTNSLKDLKFLGKVVNRSRISKKGLLSTYVLNKDMEKFGVKPGVSSDVANFLDQTKDAKVILVAEQRNKNEIKVSMRSNNSRADVAKLAAFFGGGGHKKAAGFEVEGEIKDILNKNLTPE